MKNTKKKTVTKKQVKVCDCVNCVGQENYVLAQTTTDFKNVLLIVSIAINTFFLVSWLTIQVASYYSAEALTFVVG